MHRLTSSSYSPRKNKTKSQEGAEKKDEKRREKTPRDVVGESQSDVNVEQDFPVVRV